MTALTIIGYTFGAITLAFIIGMTLKWICNPNEQSYNNRQEFTNDKRIENL